jgi:hypothetical protein
MNLLLLGKRLNKSESILFSLYNFREDKLDILNHGVCDIGHRLLLIFSNRNGVGIVECESADINVLVGLIH